ncbi:MAG: SDR family oxidoreductase [Syntrophales bacterium]|nr:SDR family oxidoreductase [Syntrophales bacterium]
MKKRVLVTGGAGFLGSHLCDQLINKGYEVLCLDNLFTGDKTNIRHLLPHPCFEFIRHDITMPIYLEVDEIYNLACPASPIHYQYNPIKTIKTNIMGTINTLGIAKRVKAKILLASTSEVYGDPEEHPQKESYWGRVNPIGVRSCYDEGKRAAECLMMDYHRQNGVPVKIVRIFNTYGPRMAVGDGRVISNFIIQALKNEDITIYGDGRQTRTFCYVEDLIEGLMAMMATPAEITGPINLGHPQERTIRELAELIVRLTGSSSKIVYLPRPADDPQKRQPDITRAREILDWSPKTPLEEGLKMTIDYFRKEIRQ